MILSILYSLHFHDKFLKLDAIFKESAEKSILFDNNESVKNPFKMKKNSSKKNIKDSKKKTPKPSVKKSKIPKEKQENKIKLRKRSEKEYVTVSKSLIECLSYLKGTEEIFDLIAENPFKKILKHQKELQGNPNII